jgi:hypothetical protein
MCLNTCSWLNVDLQVKNDRYHLFPEWNAWNLISFIAWKPVQLTDSDLEIDGNLFLSNSSGETSNQCRDEAHNCVDEGSARRMTQNSVCRWTELKSRCCEELPISNEVHIAIDKLWRWSDQACEKSTCLDIRLAMIPTTSFTFGDDPRFMTTWTIPSSVLNCFKFTVVHLIASTPPNLTHVKIWEYLKMETLIEHD